MATGWVRAFDQSYQRIPIARLDEIWASGYRVMGGYAGGGSSQKWLTTKEINEWLSFGPDAGIAALFEVTGTEPIDHPAWGVVHAKAARTAWRARGYPDSCSILPAVDQNVTITQARTELAEYFELWAKTDTKMAIPYVEMDAGAFLFNSGITAGTFTPAAFSWEPSNTLVTPDNAPSHVVWTQEHNGQNLAGGNIDIGHIRLTAPIQWRSKEMTTVTDKDQEALIWRVNALIDNTDVMGGPTKGEKNELKAAIDALNAKISGGSSMGGPLQINGTFTATESVPPTITP